MRINQYYINALIYLTDFNDESKVITNDHWYAWLIASPIILLLERVYKFMDRFLFYLFSFNKMEVCNNLHYEAFQFSMFTLTALIITCS